MRNLLNIKVLLLVVLAVSGLGWNSGYWLIDKSESFISEKQEISAKGFLVLSPDVALTEIGKGVDLNLVNRDALTETVRKEIKMAWKKNNIPANFIDEQAGGISFDNYMKFIDLNEEIIRANNYQNHPLDNRRVNSSGLTQNIFVNTPRIDFGFGKLSNLYKTPYFAITGVRAFNSKPATYAARQYADEANIRYGEYHVYYFILVNVDTGEIIYREFKKVSTDIKPRALRPFLYNSYTMLRKNLRK